MSVRLNGTSRNGTADDRSDRVPLRSNFCIVASCIFCCTLSNTETVLFSAAACAGIVVFYDATRVRLCVRRPQNDGIFSWQI